MNNFEPHNSLQRILIIKVYLQIVGIIEHNMWVLEVQCVLRPIHCFSTHKKIINKCKIKWNKADAENIFIINCTSDYFQCYNSTKLLYYYCIIIVVVIIVVVVVIIVVVVVCARPSSLLKEGRKQLFWATFEAMVTL